jgi:hypothetical protein
MRLPNVLIFSALAASLSSSVTGADCAHSEQDRGLTVCPGTLASSEIAELTIPAKYRGMIIYTPSGRAFYVVSDDYKSIDVADLSKGGKIKLSPSDLKGKRLDGNNNSVIENVFRESGRYEIYVADNIDTEHENALSAKLAFIYSREAR